MLGSNVQDGYKKSFDSRGRNAKLEDSRWGYSDGFKILNGWKFQDLREPDKASEPIMAETAQYSWVNKLVSNYNAQRTGNLFPAPGPYVMQKGDVPRGAGLSVQVMDHVEMEQKVPLGYESSDKGMKTHNVLGRIAPVAVLRDKMGYRL